MKVLLSKCNLGHFFPEINTWNLSFLSSWNCYITKCRTRLKSEVIQQSLITLMHLLGRLITLVIRSMWEAVRHFCNCWHWFGLIYYLWTAWASNIFLVSTENDSSTIDIFFLCTISQGQGKMWQGVTQWKHYIYQAHLVNLQEIFWLFLTSNHPVQHNISHDIEKTDSNMHLIKNSKLKHEYT